MFTGIIEALGTVQKMEWEGKNLHFTIESPISKELKIDQSVSHNGVCLTVVALGENTHTVTAIEETLQRTSFGQLTRGSAVNLERAMLANSRLDGHIVQGHVDTTGICLKIKELEGSWYYTFKYQPAKEHLLVDKGSICIDGVSLTVVKPQGDAFTVAIIPYTYQHTIFSSYKPGTVVNLEFDVIGKYIARYVELYMAKRVKA